MLSAIFWLRSLSLFPPLYLPLSPVDCGWQLYSQFKFWAGTWACLQEDLLSWTFMGAVTNGLLKFLFKPLQAEWDRERREVMVSRKSVLSVALKRVSTVSCYSQTGLTFVVTHTYTNTHTHPVMPDTDTLTLFVCPSLWLHRSVLSHPHLILEAVHWCIKNRGHGRSWYVSAVYYSGVQQQMWDMNAHTHIQ